MLIKNGQASLSPEPIARCWEACDILENSGHAVGGACLNQAHNSWQLGSKPHNTIVDFEERYPEDLNVNKLHGSCVRVVINLATNLHRHLIVLAHCEPQHMPGELRLQHCPD